MPEEVEFVSGTKTQRPNRAWGLYTPAYDSGRKGTSGGLTPDKLQIPGLATAFETFDADCVDAFLRDPMCFLALQPASLGSFLGAASQLSDPVSLHRIRNDLPFYLFSGSEDSVGQQLEGVRVLIERYREAGISDLSFDFYPGGRHEMLNEINRDEVRAHLLEWISTFLEKQRLRQVTMRRASAH